MNTPSKDTDNWESTSIDAPRQKAGEVLERQSEAADTVQHTPDPIHEQRLAAEAEALAERQAANDNATPDAN